MNGADARDPNESRFYTVSPIVEWERLRTGNGESNGSWIFYRLCLRQVPSAWQEDRLKYHAPSREIGELRWLAKSSAPLQRACCLSNKRILNTISGP